MRSVRFPLRFKIMLGLLAVVSIVVTLITYTMANLFHTDKTAYIHDLTSVMALRAADETRSLFQGYRERLQTYAIVLDEDSVADERRIEMVRELMEGFPECVAITLYDHPGNATSTIYDAEVLERVGLSKADVSTELESISLPWSELANGTPFLQGASFADRLPSFVLATEVKASAEADSSTFVCAVLTVDGLRRATIRSGAFDSFVADGRNVLLSHRDLSRVQDSASPDWVPEASEGALAMTRGMTREYLVGNEEMIGGFASTGFGGTIAGVQLPRSAAYLASRELLSNLVLVSLVLLLVAALAALFWSRRITASIEGLAGATRRVGRGEFDVQVEEESQDEIGDLARSFNQMAGELRTREVALVEAHAQLVQSEKLAAFGQLGAGIAHEVKNPLAGILGCAQLSLRASEAGTPLATNLKMIEKETRRCKEIIENLLKFARQEKAELREVDLTQVVEDAAAIVRHQIELAGVHLDVELRSELPSVLANTNQIQQVVMNLMINAQQAMAGEPGNISVRSTVDEEGQVLVSVTDDGPGIPPEHKSRIFEPFFTTKPSGIGTGLGLSVSYGIIRDHGGRIEIDSEVGQGTSFRLVFPAQRADSKNGGEAELSAAA